MTATPYATIESDAQPLVFVRFTGVKSTDENFTAYLDEVKSCYSKGDTIGIVFDGSRASLPQPRHVQQQADWLKSNWDMMKNQCAGTAYIIPNSMIRGVLNIIFGLQKQPVPYTIVNSEEAAVAWLAEKGIQPANC